MSTEKATEVPLLSVNATEKSTARTGTPAPLPFDAEREMRLERERNAWMADYLAGELATLAKAAKVTMQVLGEVGAERQRQDAQWGGPVHDDEHSRYDWWSFRREFEERVIGSRSLSVQRDGLVKIAALAVAQIESTDRRIAEDNSLNDHVANSAGDIA